MGQRLEVKFGRLTPMAHVQVLAVVFAVGNALMRNIRHGQQEVALFGFERRETRAERLPFVCQRFHARHDGGHVAALLFDPWNVLARRVLLRFACVRLAADGAALRIDLKNPVNDRVHILVAGTHGLLHLIRIGADGLDVQHT